MPITSGRRCRGDHEGMVVSCVEFGVLNVETRIGLNIWLYASTWGETSSARGMMGGYLVKLGHSGL